MSTNKITFQIDEEKFKKIIAFLTTIETNNKSLHEKIVRVSIAPESKPIDKTYYGNIAIEVSELIKELKSSIK
jgi:hypothetical protein